MGTSIVDVRFSIALAARTFDDAARGELELPSDLVATTTTRLIQAPQPWAVARVHLVERLGELSRCELLLTRVEDFYTPAAQPAAPPTWFDRTSQRMDQMQTATDPLRGGNWLNPAGGPIAGVPGLGTIPGAIQGVARNLWNVAGQQWNDMPSFTNWEQDLLGIQAPLPAWAPELAPSPADFLGTFRSVLVRRLAQADGAPLFGRWFSGLVTEFEDLGVFASDNRRLVRVVIEPQLAKLALRRNHHIFERLDAASIAAKIFEEAGIYAQTFDRGTVSFEARPRCIQYGETDLDFVLRLFSEEGVLPVFDHHLGAERLRLLTHAELAWREHGIAQTLDPDDLPRDTLVHAPAVSSTEEVLFDFAVRRLIRPAEAGVRATSFSASSTDPSIPTHTMQASARPLDAGSVALDASLATAPGLAFDHHLFPARTSFDFDADSGMQTSVVDLEREAHLELVAARAGARRGRGRTNAVALRVGELADVVDGRGDDPRLVDADVAPFGRFVLTSLELLAETGQAALGPSGTLWHLPRRPAAFSPVDAVTLESVIEAVPDDVEHVPARRRAPHVEGVQTLITKASATPWTEGSSRIGVDSIGRVRGRFHWDRRPDTDANGEQPLSPPIRVAGPWAGHSWGSSFLPREGMELLVVFLHGNPEEPIALGAVHGFTNPAPRERPHLEVIGKDGPKENHLGDDEVKKGRLHYVEDHSIRPDLDRALSMIRTQVDPVPDERPRGYHELSFDDTPRKERVRLHSEGHLEETVENDHRTLVGRDQTNIVQGKHTESVANQTLIVEGDRTKIVDGHEIEVVGGKQKIIVLGQRSLWVDRDRALEVGATLEGAEASGAGDASEEIGEKAGDGALRELVSKKDRRTLVEGNDARTVGGDQTETIGGTYQLGGEPLAMKAVAQSAAAGAGAAPPSVVSDDRNLTLDGGDAETELRADGRVYVKADRMKLSGSTGVRFECGDEVWLELNPGEIRMHAPGGVDLHLGCSYMTLGPAGEGGEIDMKVGRLEGDNGRFHTILRAGAKSDMPYDALEGGPGWIIDPVDTMRIQGGLASFACRRVEIQKGDEAKTVIRTPTAEEKQLLEDIEELEARIAELRRKASRQIRERDTARMLYRLAATRRELVELQIKLDQGADDELREAVADVVAAERAVQKARAELRAARDELERARMAAEDTTDERERVSDAEEALEDAEDELRDANEELEDQREEHGKLVEDYENARAEESKREQELYAAQDRIVATNHELRAAEAELEQKRRRASALELDDPSEQAEEEAAE